LAGLAIVAAGCQAASNNVKSGADAKGSQTLLPECAAYADAFARCTVMAVGSARASSAPHPVFQPAFQDDVSKERVREQCRAAAALTQQSCN
jgi:hypothetical protein